MAAKPKVPKRIPTFELPPAAFSNAMNTNYDNWDFQNWPETREFKLFMAGAGYMADQTAAAARSAHASLQHMAEYRGRP